MFVCLVVANRNGYNPWIWSENEGQSLSSGFVE